MLHSAVLCIWVDGNFVDTHSHVRVEWGSGPVKILFVCRGCNLVGRVAGKERGTNKIVDVCFPLIAHILCRSGLMIVWLIFNGHASSRR